jgi:F-type H+-transporting ATPase subunit a
MKPFKQFEMVIIEKVKMLFDLSMTNGGLYLVLSLMAFFILVMLCLVMSYLIAWVWRRSLENAWRFVREMVYEQIGNVARKLVPTIFTVFILILILNLIGLIPFSFAVTGQSVFTFCVSLTAFLALIIEGFMFLQFGFLNIFVPKGVSKGLLPLLVSIEILSFLIRPLSLAIRLFANMLAGHILLLLISSTVISLVIVSYIGVGFSYVLLASFIMLELGIACLQAYVFSILLCIYNKDAFIMHFFSTGHETAPSSWFRGQYLTRCGNAVDVLLKTRSMIVLEVEIWIPGPWSFSHDGVFYVRVLINDSMVLFPASLVREKGKKVEIRLYIKDNYKLVIPFSNRLGLGEVFYKAPKQKKPVTAPHPKKEPSKGDKGSAPKGDIVKPRAGGSGKVGANSDPKDSKGA